MSCDHEVWVPNLCLSFIEVYLILELLAVSEKKSQNEKKQPVRCESYNFNIPNCFDIFTIFLRLVQGCVKRWIHLTYYRLNIL